jgi:hypothetical protein
LGCGGDNLRRVAVKGTVTSNGQPKNGVAITFLPAVGLEAPSAGAQVVDGKYELSSEVGPIAGPHKVLIESMGERARQLEQFSQNNLQSDKETGPATWEFKIVIPDQPTFEYNFDLK